MFDKIGQRINDTFLNSIFNKFDLNNVIEMNAQLLSILIKYMQNYN